jgi:hypothetical protein
MFGECFSGAALVYVGGLFRLTRAETEALHHELARVHWDHDSSTESQRRDLAAADQFVGECVRYPESRSGLFDGQCETVRGHGDLRVIDQLSAVLSELGGRSSQGRHRGRCRERSRGANPEYPYPL